MEIKKQIRQNLQRLRRIQLEELEVFKSEVFRRMSQTTEFFNILMSQHESSLPEALRATQFFLQLKESHLHTVKATEAKRQERWQELKKDTPEKRLYALKEMAITAWVDKHGDPNE